MNRVFLLGECMIELTPSDTNAFKQSFSGDVFNTAVYLKRFVTQAKVHLITAIGKDKFSLAMLEYFHRQHIETSFVFQSDYKIPGLYAIQTDEVGERSFTYWRENSAARGVMSFIDAQVVESISTGDIVFFAGISLAVISPTDRSKFWQFIKQLKDGGAILVFDPNYRAKMWDSSRQAKEQFEQAFIFADILLPGVDDFEQLYGLKTPKAVYDFCKPYQFDELVIKNGEADIVCHIGEHTYHFPIIPVENVVDTTSAGDSFNGVYLGARIKGIEISDAIELASKAAGFVIQHHGAIVDQCAYQKFINEQLN